MGNSNSIPEAAIVALVMNLLGDAFVVVIIYVVQKKSAKLKAKWKGLKCWQKNGLTLVLVAVLAGGWVICFKALNQEDSTARPTTAPTIRNPNNVSLSTTTSPTTKPTIAPTTKPTTAPTTKPTTSTSPTVMKVETSGPSGVGRLDSSRTLSAILERGYLIVGVRPQQGYATKNSDGRWEGFDVDLGRAAAAGIFGQERFKDGREEEPILFYEVEAGNRFVALDNEEIDMLLGITSQTLERSVNEVSLAVVLKCIGYKMELWLTFSHGRRCRQPH
jgi:ABC-type amino acid transport substrate-binding protein